MSLVHPEKELLIAFGQGKLTGEDSAPIEQHLDVCPACCETLLDLAEDTFVGLLRRAKQNVDVPSSETVPIEPAADGVDVNRSREDVATVLVQSGETAAEDELPVELREHPRYHIVELIGRGGMGNVYRAEHRLMNRPVAIKVINSQLVRHPQAVERFRREVQAAAKLSHPNIVAAHDAEQAGNAHFLVMEFVEGTDLASVVKQRGPMAVAEACECIRQAATGLQHAHERGMVHRDIKPHNLMLAAGGQVRILDFGLAGFAEAAFESSPVALRQESRTSSDADLCDQPATDDPAATRDRLFCREATGRQEAAAHLTAAGSVMGTPDYMAPEQAADAHSADIRADIYSLGCTLHFLLTGKPPFEAENVLAKLKAHAEHDRQPLTDLRDDVPTDLERIAAKMMAKNPADRFQTPAEVVAALQACEKFVNASARTRRFGWNRAARIVGPVMAGCVILAGVIVLSTNRGWLEIRSQVDDLKVTVRNNGEQVEFSDLKTGSQVKWVPGGKCDLEIVGDRNDVKLDQHSVTVSRFGHVIVTATWNAAGLDLIRSFAPTDQTISRDGVTAEDGGWKVVASADRAAQMFEISGPPLQDGGVYFCVAKLKTENVVGKAYLDMLSLIPRRMDAFMHTGIDRAISGTTDWQTIEVPMFLQPGEKPNFIKINVSIVGSGTVWIKDIELRARRNSAMHEPDQPAPAANQNLLTDPSFENTPLTQLPIGWRAWLNDGQEFRCEVVAGGHTGQRCLKISGKGTRGVVFGNDLKSDRTKRYALKGWAKFEGDKDARAVIKFNYFRGSEFLGVHDLVGATADQPGWHLFEKTDTLDAYPTADHFYAMCHVEGSGSGWFDDLELVAYDRDKLPKDFDARHGRHNRLHGPNSLHRWVGTWDTEYVFRETDNSPTETKLSMTTTSERTLGDYFLMSHGKAKPPATEERLQFLLFDQNLGAFRQWFFSSNGKAFEWRGPWNNEKQTLELRMLPDASNLHSSEHFVDADHIEAKLRLQYVMGQRDAGRWAAKRKAFDGKVDVPIAKTHAAEPVELSQLNKFVGEWTIHATYKPSVWNPQQREETITETSQWILGGRFLMTRAFNEQNQLTSIWIATYEPREKSNRFWFFNADGSSGEWRLTWDEASRSFDFRAIDMPRGWTGTGTNRWINDDTFDNEALIKDENGRVLLDSAQARRRRK